MSKMPPGSTAVENKNGRTCIPQIFIHHESFRFWRKQFDSILDPGHGTRTINAKTKTRKRTDVGEYQAKVGQMFRESLVESRKCEENRTIHQ